MNELAQKETKELVALGRTYAYRAQSGEISYDEAREKCAPLIKEINHRMKMLSEKYKAEGLKGAGTPRFKVFTDFLRIK